MTNRKEASAKTKAFREYIKKMYPNTDVRFYTDRLKDGTLSCKPYGLDFFTYDEAQEAAKKIQKVFPEYKIKVRKRVWAWDPSNYYFIIRAHI
jgi:hypothetical protein